MGMSGSLLLYTSSPSLAESCGPTGNYSISGQLFFDWPFIRLYNPFVDKGNHALLLLKER